LCGQILPLGTDFGLEISLDVTEVDVDQFLASRVPAPIVITNIGDASIEIVTDSSAGVVPVDSDGRTLREPLESGYAAFHRLDLLPGETGQLEGAYSNQPCSPSAPTDSASITPIVPITLADGSEISVRGEAADI
jgi:hypothetical protein